MNELERLLHDWMAAEAGIIFEYAENFASELQMLVDDAKMRAEALGITWNDELVPDFITVDLLEAKFLA